MGTPVSVKHTRVGRAQARQSGLRPTYINWHDVRLSLFWAALPTMKVSVKVVDGRPSFAKPSIDGGKQEEIAVIDPDFE
jgi:hypothetical protein